MSSASATFDPSHTFEEGLIRLAEALGLLNDADFDSDGSAKVPADPYVSSRLKRAYNDGLKLLQLRAPALGQRWRCLSPPITRTLSPAGNGPYSIEGDPTRYRLPWYAASGPLTQWSWALGTNETRGRVTSTNPDIVEDRINRTPTTGRPELTAIRKLEDGGLELLVAPAPDQAYVLKCHVQSNVRRLTELTELHPFGAASDMAVLAAAKYAFVMDDAADGRLAMFKGNFEQLADQALAFDAKALGAQTLGEIIDPDRVSTLTDAQQYRGTGVTEYNGVTI